MFNIDNELMNNYVWYNEELVIHEIRIGEATGLGDSDSQIKSFEVIMPLKTPINYESPIVRCVALSRLVTCEKE